ncbi:MAG TPA: hypothetical protein PLS21_07845 [Synergistales bacterium]|nr:hypothetical protein [Synergistales bacterium]HQO83889.1 hypothetical protein [Synergistales bacterium]
MIFTGIPEGKNVFAPVRSVEVGSEKETAITIQEGVDPDNVPALEMV